jgi:hypothetical protein
MVLTDDDLARDFGKEMILDMMRGESMYATCTMDATQRARRVCSLCFPGNEAGPRWLKAMA